MKKLLSVLLTAFVLLFMCSCEAPLKHYSASYTDVFDTVCVFGAYCRSEEEFNAASEAVHNELLRLHRLFDIYSEEAGGIAQLNRSGSLEGPDKDILSVILLGQSFFGLSGGKLNIAMGSVLEIWHEARENKTLPEVKALYEASLHTDISNLSVSEDLITLDDSEASLDLGAIAKGYACDKVADMLVKMGIYGFTLDLGGNIKACGEKPNGDIWNIGIKDPNGGIFTTIKVSDVSVVTSGDYERFFEADGKKYSHIIDTDTLFPAERYRSVTVVCESSAVADALSTSLFCMDEASGRRLAEEMGAEVLWIYPDGRKESYGSKYF